MLYYYANEIILTVSILLQKQKKGFLVVFQSEDLCQAVWQSEWYNETPHCKFMMQIMMMRSKTPLMLKIGPFGSMSLRAFLSVLNLVKIKLSYFWV